MFLREREEREEEEKKKERKRDNKTAKPTFSVTRHCNYFDYIREMASILC